MHWYWQNLDLHYFVNLFQSYCPWYHFQYLENKLMDFDKILYILRTARGFWKYCKKGGGGGLLALKSHIICSSKKSCMKTKVDIVCFSLSSLFLIDPKMTTAQRKKMHTALPYTIKTPDIIAFLSEWGSFKKCLASITHKYAMAVERIYKLSKYWSNRRFYAFEHGLVWNSIEI